MEKRAEIRGVLYDMDGTILNTEHVHYDGWELAFRETGLPFRPEYIQAMRGVNREKQAVLFEEWFHGAADYERMHRIRSEYCDRWFAEHGIEVFPGYRELDRWFREHKILRALCSGTREEVIRKEYASVGLEFDYDASVCGNQVRNCKPAPDIFLMGAERLGVSPENCLVLEDSRNGVLAGHAAGCQVIMIPDIDQATEDLREKTIAVCANLLEVRDLMIAIMGHD